MRDGDTGMAGQGEDQHSLPFDGVKIRLEPDQPKPATEARLISREAQNKARRRRRPVRARTIAVNRLNKEQLRLGRILNPDRDYWVPKTRADCAGFARPCGFVTCKHHLYLDVNPVTGSIKLNFPDLEVWEMKESCALDVADRGEVTLEEVGALMNLTRERVRQIELHGLEKLRECDDVERLRGLI